MRDDDHHADPLDYPVTRRKLDPLSPPPVTRLDVEAMINQLDNTHDQAGEEWDRLTEGLRGVLEFLTEPINQSVHCDTVRRGPRKRAEAPKHILQQIAIRAIGIYYLLFPEAFEGESMRRISEKVGLSQWQLSNGCSAATRRFGVTMRGQPQARNGGHKRRLSKKP